MEWSKTDEWTKAVKEYIQTLKPVPVNQETLFRLVPLIDLTSLNEDDTENSIALLCQKAENTYGHVAGVCVNPQFVRMVVANFAGKPIKAVTVANFPRGDDNLDEVLVEISNALGDGAEEIDVIFPYQRFLAGDRDYAHIFVESCKAVCGKNVLLKVILETGALQSLPLIAEASYDVLAAGADFIKTSSGKISQGATLEAAATMLVVIHEATLQLRRPLGFKASGGIKDVEQAALYVELADKIMGKEWVNKDSFRIGSSKLLDEILQ